MFMTNTRGSDDFMSTKHFDRFYWPTFKKLVMTLIERGMIQPGDTLTDSRRRHAATVRIDGTLASGEKAGSIHKVGALVQGLDACNGWTFWHVERDGALEPIDALRQIVRSELELVA